MAFRTTPQLGPQLPDVFNGLPYWDAHGGISEPSYRLGNKEVGSDGHDYIWVRASAAISAAGGNGTQVSVTAEGTAAGGSGGWYAPPGVAIPEGAYFHARKGALGAP